MAADRVARRDDSTLYGHLFATAGGMMAASLLLLLLYSFCFIWSRARAQKISKDGRALSVAQDNISSCQVLTSALWIWRRSSVVEDVDENSGDGILRRQARVIGAMCH